MRLLLLLLLTISLCYSASPNSQAQNSAGWRLVWADEFDYTGLPDQKKWSYDVGGHGWGNKELQFYTDRRKENARVENGSLIIEARRDNWRGHEYTSARLVSKRKGDWMYGRIEARAKLPTGKGTWPAIWMLPTEWKYGSWPGSGEIDIMEQVGYEPQVIHASVHTKAYNHVIGTHKTATTTVENATAEFNVYAVEWTPDEIRAYVNDRHYFTFKNERLTNTTADFRHWPFDQSFHLLLNIAVGGNWGGARGVDKNIWPQRMTIDYVRVYQAEKTSRPSQ
jgi:beta-glucanase (GH16 family)